MGIKRVVDVNFWNDDKVVELFSPEDKYFMLYMLTNPHTTQLGIYSINVKIMAFELGYSPEAVSVLLERFEKKYNVIRYDINTKELAIKNYLKHSIIKGGAPVRDCLIKEIKQVKSKELLKYVFANLKQSNSINETVINLIKEYEKENGEIKYSNEKEKRNKKEINENENENENDVSYPVSYHDTLDDTYHDTFGKENKPEKPKKPQRHKYGDYGNVLFTDEQYEKLKKEFPDDYKFRIQNVDDYVQSTGKKYKDYLATIRTWARRDKQKKTNNNSTGNIFFDILREEGKM